MDTKKAATTYWNACEARDWDSFGATLAENVVYECPQTRERTRGRDAYVRFISEFPGDWHLSIVQVVGDEEQAVTWTSFKMDGADMTGIAFLDFDTDGKIVRVTDFWPDAYEPPADRAHLVERY